MPVGRRNCSHGFAPRLPAVTPPIVVVAPPPPSPHSLPCKRPHYPAICVAHRHQLGPGEACAVHVHAVDANLPTGDAVEGCAESRALPPLLSNQTPCPLLCVQDVQSLNVATAAYVSTLFDIGAGVGGPMCGLLADKVFGGCPITAG